jgi:hypothetical protein
MMQPTPNWRGLFQDIRFIQMQGLRETSINLSGRGYSMLRLPGQTFIWIEFTRTPS